MSKGTSTDKRSVAIYLPDLSGGGTERLQIDLAPLFLSAKLDVTFLLGMLKGPLVNQVPPGARVVSLNASRQIMALMPIVHYLRRERPSVLIAHTEHGAIISLWARAIAGCDTRVIVCQHNNFSAQAQRKSWQFRILRLLFRRFLCWADRIVAVSSGVADDLATTCHIPRERITVIYNGVVGSDFETRYNAAPDHAWFKQGVPVIVAAGRFVEQKDFATLISAFSIVSRKRNVRLILLGEGPLREPLQALARDLRASQFIDMPGFRDNALAYMRAASIVALSSRYEGFALVIAEALACGTPVVSTDCPHGPSEILDNGRFGRLTPVGNALALAESIVATLDCPPARMDLQVRGNLFSLRASADRYLALLDELLVSNVASID